MKFSRIYEHHVKPLNIFLFPLTFLELNKLIAISPLGKIKVRDKKETRIN